MKMVFIKEHTSNGVVFKKGDSADKIDSLLLKILKKRNVVASKKAATGGK